MIILQLENIQMTKNLEILEILEEARLGTAANIIAHAWEQSDNPAQRVFVEGLRMLSRAQLLSHIFSPERMMLVEAAIRATKGRDA